MTTHYYKERELCLVAGRLAIFKRITFQKRNRRKLAIVTFSGERFDKAVPYEQLSPFIENNE